MRSSTSAEGVVMDGRSSRRIVVGVDGSKSALVAVRWAAREAVRRRCELAAVHVYGWTGPGMVSDPEIWVQYLELIRRAAARCLDEAAAEAADAAPDVEVVPRSVEGSPEPVLRAEADHAELVVVGARGAGGFVGMLLGSVATSLVVRSPCPVVVVRDAPRPEDAPVVVGVDGSPASEAALAFAFEETSALGAPLVAVHTWWDLLVEPVLAPLLDWDAIETDERQVLAERLAGWSAKYPDVDVRRVVTRDRPAHALLEQSETARLVVVGSRGRGTTAGMLLGSVGRALVNHAACSVAVVKPTAGDGGE
ncbi:universal stress protein [Pseudonocardia sp. T1-2H]|uniref:universal stress protein n=1 Tax=Pseudonocardia sp. T1-2H TaxID=3128899 RepID=UPI003100CF7E